MYAVIEVQGIESQICLKGTISERADDIRLIIHWLKQMEIASIIDQQLPPPHGNRKGLSYGQLSVLFLCYVVTQSDHRLCAVETWVEKHRQTLEMATGWNIGLKDATDDSLADLLTIFGSSQPEETENIAIYLNGDDEEELPIGEGFEVPLGSIWWEEENQQWYRWSERWLVVCSYALQQRQLKSLSTRLSKAESALEKLVQKTPQDEVILQTKVEQILKRYRVSEQIVTNIEKKITYQKVYQGAGRGSENRPNPSCSSD